MEINSTSEYRIHLNGPHNQLYKSWWIDCEAELALLCFINYAKVFEKLRHKSWYFMWTARKSKSIWKLISIIQNSMGANCFHVLIGNELNSHTQREWGVRQRLIFSVILTIEDIQIILRPVSRHRTKTGKQRREGSKRNWNEKNNH